MLLDVAIPGQHLLAAFGRCGLWPINRSKSVEPIPHRMMDVDSQATRDLLSSTLGEKLEELRGVGKKDPKTKRAKKVAPGKSYTDVDLDLDGELDLNRELDLDREVEGEIQGGKGTGIGKGKGKGKQKAKKVEKEVDVEEEEEEEEEVVVVDVDELLDGGGD